MERLKNFHRCIISFNASKSIWKFKILVAQEVKDMYLISRVENGSKSLEILRRLLFHHKSRCSLWRELHLLLCWWTNALTQYSGLSSPRAASRGFCFQWQWRGSSDKEVLPAGCQRDCQIMVPQPLWALEAYIIVKILLFFAIVSQSTKNDLKSIVLEAVFLFCDA